MYNGKVLWSVVKKLLVLVALFGAIIYFSGWGGKIKEWFGHSQVLGERTDLELNEKVFQPAQDAVNQYLRWPHSEDLKPLPKIVIDEESQGSASSSVNLDQSLEDLAQEIKNLPQEQVIKIKEQLIKEVFPDCECSCSIVKDNN